MLTLVEEVLLLTFRDKTGRPLRLPEYSIEFAVAGAALAELALKDRIDSDLDTRVPIADDQIRVEVEDDGRQFNPLEALPVDTTASLDQRRIGGAGIHLVRSFTDDVRYHRRHGRNHVAVVMKRTEEKQTPMTG